MTIPAMTPPSIAKFAEYGVNVVGVKEVVWQPFYDHLSYAAAGASELLFYQQQKGQGTTSAPGGTGAKTYQDTNMELGAQLPQPQSLMALGLALTFYPGINPGRGAVAAADIGDFENDVWQLYRSGLLEFQIGEKIYLRQAPLGKFPGLSFIDGGKALSDTTTAGATQANVLDTTCVRGPVYRIGTTVIPWGQNFQVKLSWPGLVVLPSGQPMRIGCELLGWLARAAQ